MKSTRISFLLFGSLCAASSPVHATPSKGAATPRTLAMRRPVRTAQAPTPPPPDPGTDPAPDPGTDPAADPGTDPAAPEVAPDPAPPPADAAAPADASPPDEAGADDELTEEELLALSLALAEAEAEVIEVTGSLIARREVTSPAPVTVLDRTDLNAAGMASIGDILQDLPSQSNAINVQFNNGGDGSTRVNLRGLGAARTLVLLNGRRVVPGGTGADASVDLSSIPLAMIERVEVLKDGASAIYGSDAIGGVVNIITRTELDGSEVNLYTGTTQHGSGGTVYDLSFVTGATSARSSIMFSAGYYTSSALMAGEREFSRVDREFDYETRTATNSGSTATPDGLLVTDEDGDGVPDAGNDAWDDVIASCPSGVCTGDGRGGWRDFGFGGANDSGDLYNYQPDNYLVTPQQRYNVFATGHQRLGDHARAFFEGTYVNRTSDQKLAPEPLFLDQTGLVVSADSIYNPYGKDIGFYRRRLVELGTRDALQNVHTFRAVVGLDGQIPQDVPVVGNWKWELSFNYGRTEASERTEGNLIRSRLAAALGPSFVDGGGVARCGSVDAPGDPDCVPLDLLGGASANGGAGSITPEMAAYLTFTGISGGFNEQRTLLAQARGQLARTPWGGDLSMAIGGDVRGEAGGFDPDPLTATGDTTGNAKEPTGGEYSVIEGFGELSFVPVAGKRFAKWVELNGAVRGFRYSTFGSGATWKAGGLFRTAGGLAVRGTYSTAFRAPSITELFSGQADSFLPGQDPCDTSAGPIADPTTAAQCAEQGVPASFQNPVSQIRTKIGGNPDLEPESAGVLTAGVVLEPPAIAGLAITLDYFRFDIDDAIQSQGLEVILSNCYVQGNDDACALITRRPGTGVIDFVTDTETNVGGNATSGIDFAIAYDHEVGGVGRFRHQLEGTRLLEYTETGADGRVIDGLGVYDLGVYPKWRANWSTVWGQGGAGAGANVRFVGRFDECEDNACNDGKPSRQVERNVTADLFASYTFNNEAGTSTLAVGVNNVLDQEPAVIYSGFLADSDASTYDYLGRYFYARLTHAF